MSNNEAFLTSRAAAQKLGVSMRTVQLWVESGILRAWKTAGGHRRIARNSVDELLRQQNAAIQVESGAHVLKVVLVEDEPIQRQIYEMKFTEWALPLDLVTASNGFEGLIEIGRRKPDFIITDLDMPGMDGFEMIRAIGKDKELSSAQIVVVTGLNEKVIIEHGGLPAGIPTLNKPVPFEELRTMLTEGLLQHNK